MAALIEKLEETDAALAEHRRRLIQSEKLSAIGELAAKLAHEVLNPLAGMKAAVQLLARSHPHDPDRAAETARALSGEIARVEALLGDCSTLRAPYHRGSRSRRSASCSTPPSPPRERSSIEIGSPWRGPRKRRSLRSKSIRCW